MTLCAGASVSVSAVPAADLGPCSWARAAAPWRRGRGQRQPRPRRRQSGRCPRRRRVASPPRPRRPPRTAAVAISGSRQRRCLSCAWRRGGGATPAGCARCCGAGRCHYCWRYYCWSASGLAAAPPACSFFFLPLLVFFLPACPCCCCMLLPRAPPSLLLRCFFAAFLPS